MRVLRLALPAALLLAILTAGSAPVHGKETEAPAAKVWNGRDRFREVKAWIKEYFGATEERRAEIRTALDGLGIIKLSDVKKHAKSILKRARKARPKLIKKSGQVFEHDGLKGPIQLVGAKNRKPLFVALHGGGDGAGDGKTAMQKWGMVSGKCIVIAPTTPEKVGAAWNKPHIERWVIALIDAAKRTWDVDTNRIYLAGHSMGGYGTWSIGPRHADRFAALSACAGGVFGNAQRIASGHIPNLLNTPIWFYNSTDDKQVSFRSSHRADLDLQEWKKKGYPYEWKYDEYDNIGHGLPPKGLKPIVDWMLERKREPHPKHVVWEPSRPHKRQFAWLGKASGAARIEGRIKGNTITLSGPGSSSSTTVYLSRDLVDLAKPVTVRIDEKTVFEGLVPPRLSVLLETISAFEDPRRYYCAAVTVP